MTETKTCDNCGRTLPADEFVEFDDQLLCGECLQRLTIVCDCCETRIWRDCNAGNEDVFLCNNCYERHYYSCSECGRLIHESEVYDGDGDDPLCCDCYCSRRRGESINSYYYKPSPIFYGTGNRFFGVELEIDDAGEYSDNADEILDEANGIAEHIYCKHDGSLDEGFEIVTHPMTLDYHMNVMPWSDVLDTAKRLGYRSHQTSTCGLHIHVNRTTFGKTEDEQESCIARILYFFEKHWEELLKFSRRTEGQLYKWACRYGYKERPMEILENAKTNSSSRYMCVNLMNSSTIEFRIFRGTLKLNTLIAALQLIDMICDAAILYSDGEMAKLSWTTFVSRCRREELIRYMKERRLYINDPIEAEAEV